jgi:hypothetical protein
VTNGHVNTIARAIAVGGSAGLQVSAMARVHAATT